MAVIDSVPGIKVTVVVDGEAAEEWDPTNNFDDVEIIEQPPRVLDDDFNKPHGYIVKYIETKPGALFKFVVDKDEKFKRYGHHMAYHVELDGSNTELDHEHNEEHKKLVERGPWQGITVGYFTGDPDVPETIQEHLFRFNTLDIIEGVNLSQEELDAERKRIKDCGTLRVYLYHMRRSLRIRDWSKFRPRGEVPPITVVNQKALGGRELSHSTAYTVRPCEDQSRVDLKPCWENFLDRQYEGNWETAKPRPFAIFEFRYRTYDELVNEGIVPPFEVIERINGMGEAEKQRELGRLMAAELQRQRTATPFQEIRQGDIKPEPYSP